MLQVLRLHSLVHSMPMQNRNAQESEGGFTERACCYSGDCRVISVKLPEKFNSEGQTKAKLGSQVHDCNRIPEAFSCFSRRES